MGKPEYLYHGSTQQGLRTLEPREDPQNEQLTGKFVFATQHEAVAAMYLSPKGFPTIISRFGDVFTIVVQADITDYEQADKGGSIYLLSPDGFVNDPDIGMQESEWHTDKPVRPLREEQFTTSREAMRRSGVRIYVVESATFASIQQAADHGWENMQRITPLA